MRRVREACNPPREETEEEIEKEKEKKKLPNKQTENSSQEKGEGCSKVKRKMHPTPPSEKVVF